jgi:hypothetical protein
MESVDLRDYCAEVRGKAGLIHGSKPKRYTTYYRVRKWKNSVVHEKLPYVIPTDRRTPGQLASRAKFASGVLAWKALTNVEKDVWRVKSKKLLMNGWNLFLANYMKS